MFLTPLAILWAIPLVTLAFVLVSAPGAEVDATSGHASEGQTVTVGSRVQDYRQAVTVDVQTQAGPVAPSPLAGIVTALTVQPGTTVTTGTKLAEINGMPVFALVGGTPLYRELRPGTTGSDVQSLSAILIATGQLNSADASSTVSIRITSAIRRFQKAIGATQTGVFTPDYVSYLPEGTGPVQALRARVGRNLNVGDALVETVPAVLSAKVKPEGVGQTLSTLTGKPVTITAQGRSLELPSLTATGSDAATLGSFAATNGTITGGGEAARTTSSDDTPSSTSFSGFLVQLTAPEKVGTVPTQALWTSHSNRQCLFVSDHQTFTAMVLDHPSLLAGETGVVAIPAKNTGMRVRLNPASLPSKVLSTCR